MKIAFVFALSALATNAQVFNSFEVCGASASAQNGTLVNGMNGRGTVVGRAYTATHQAVGYMRTIDGKVTCIIVPGSNWTSAQSINNAGIVTGSFSTSPEEFAEAFILNTDGSLTTFSVPQNAFTSPAGINESGVVAGTATPTFGFYSAFIRAADGTLINFDAPSGTTSVAGINDEGAVTGSVTKGRIGFSLGFVRSPDGTFQEFAFPGGCDQGVDATYPAAINQAGDVTGHYDDCSGKAHGFVRTKDNVFTTFDPPGSVDAFPLAIDSQGDIAGYFINGAGGYVGFVRAGGGTNAITTFSVPGSVYTAGDAINGTIMGGTYQDTGLVYHGFIVSSVGADPAGSITGRPTKAGSQTKKSPPRQCLRPAESRLSLHTTSTLYRSEPSKGLRLADSAIVCLFSACSGC